MTLLSNLRTRSIVRCFVVMIILSTLAVASIQAWYLIRIGHYVDENPTTTAFMERQFQQAARKGESIEIKYEWVPYSRISSWLKRATMAAEDVRFMQHGGIDWYAVTSAYEVNRQAGRIVTGGSSITQQLAKNLFLSPDRSYLRKAQEMILAMMIESMMTKERILELYLNVIEWGDKVYGAEAAAHHYYQTSAAQLSNWQACLLAARIPRPRYFSDGHTPVSLIERSEKIRKLSFMVRPPSVSE